MYEVASKAKLSNLMSGNQVRLMTKTSEILLIYDLGDLFSEEGESRLRPW